MFLNNIYSLKIFNWFDKEVVDKIVANCENRKYNNWDIILVEWEDSNWEWFIILKWRVSVSIYWQKIVDLNAGDIFWEIALLNEENRTATVKAQTELELIVLKMEHIIEIINNDKNSLNKTILKRIEENLERE